MARTRTAYSARERLADGCIHALGVTASLAGAAVIVATAAGAMPAIPVLPVAVYAASLVAVFAFSAGYHLVARPRLKSVLRRLDHAAIYLKIAGTYTPLALIAMGGLAGRTLLAGVWSISLFGVALKLLWPGRLERTSYVLYLAAGWAGLLALKPVMAALSLPVLVLLGAGGLLYTAGVAFHLWERLPYHTAVWHGFVLAASACHYAAIVCALRPALGA